MKNKNLIATIGLGIGLGAFLLTGASCGKNAIKTRSFTDAITGENVTECDLDADGDRDYIIAPKKWNGKFDLYVNDGTEHFKLIKYDINKGMGNPELKQNLTDE